MKWFMPNKRWWSLLGLLFLTACVTVNIYFPAAAAERAADQIIQDVWGEQQPDATSEKSTPPQEGRLDSRSEWRLAWFEQWLDILVPPAQAKADININTPAIKALENAMAARFRQLAPHFNSGAVGLTRDGLVKVRDPNAIPLKNRNRVKQLVAAENKDRNALYREIAKANGQPQWESEIRATFARRWVSNARSGWWYQDSSGSWRQK